MNNKVDVDQLIASQLQAVGQRYTSNRRRLISILLRSSKPLSINQILDMDPELAQSSVYRNLTVLEEAGSIARIVTSADHARYELAEEILEHHHHIICSPCGEILDFRLSDSIEETLEASLQEIADQLGFTLDTHRLDLIGTCTLCKDNS
jgi:Fe2+ or Zn2+ uptake regulation protein|tara:strand:+ start:449 stop:898 length:450 start_codon:yes stop_codon:yes gene_type:complete